MKILGETQLGKNPSRRWDLNPQPLLDLVGCSTTELLRTLGLSLNVMV